MIVSTTPNGGGRCRGLTRVSRWSFHALFFYALFFYALVALNLPPAVGQTNPIVHENANPGTDRWLLTNPANDLDGQIKGFGSATSVNLGESITFFVTVAPAQPYWIEIYRMGWYGDTGGRLLQTVGPLAGFTQAAPVIDPHTGMVTSPWSPSYTLTIPHDWVSGIYLAKLINDQGFENYIIFAVRDDARRADFLYQQPVTTYQAYNAYPLGGIGKSLYTFNSSPELTALGTQQAVQVSFDRPYMGVGAGDFFIWELPLIRWLEREGYDVSYATNLDLDREGAALLSRYRGFFSTGHDEYWSKPMYDAAEAARDSGVNLAFFGSNAVYWQIRMAASKSRVPQRVMICYKDPALDPVANPALETGLWRDLGRPEQTLIGVQYISYNELSDTANADYIVVNSDSSIYSGTGFNDGDTVSGIVGYEVDTLFAEYPGPVALSYETLSRSPFLDIFGDVVIAESSIYQAPSQAWVFASGTMSWSWALSRQAFLDPGIQITTANVLERFLQTPSPNRPLIEADFNAGSDGFSYADDAFRGTDNPAYARGDLTNGALRVVLGGVDNHDVRGLSGGWQTRFTLDQARTVELSFRYRLSLAAKYDDDAFAQVLVELDGGLFGRPPADFVAQLDGDQRRGGENQSTGWQTITLDFGLLDAGSHVLSIGGFNNEKEHRKEITEILIDDVLLR